MGSNVKLGIVECPHDTGIIAVNHFLATESHLNKKQAWFILEATHFCLDHNYIQFDGQYYLQHSSIAMGAHFVSSYANLTMGLWENEYIWHNNPFTPNLIYYGRYIDDIIIIWDGPATLVEDLVAHCKNNMFGLSFTHVCDPTTLAFLDLELSHLDNAFIAKNDFKPTACNSYLHFSSCHPPQGTQHTHKPILQT